MKGRKIRTIYCCVCGEEKSRKHFDARGRSRHICKECYELPVEVRSEALRMDTLNWITFKHPKSRNDWAKIEQYAAQFKNEESGQLAREYLEEHSSHYQARMAHKEQKQNRTIKNTNRNIMKKLLEQIESTYTEFSQNAEDQASKGNKTAGVRARKSSLQIDKMMKEFRKLSVTDSKL